MVSSDVTQLSADLSNLDLSGIAANADALSALTARVDSADGIVTAVSSDVTSLSSSVNGQIATINQSLTTLANDVGNASAVYALDLDVNGHIAGIRLENSGDSSEFIVNADAFRVYNGSSDSAAFEVVDGQVYLGSINVRGMNIEELTVQNLEGDINVITAFNGSGSRTWGPTSAGYVTLTEVVLPANSTGINHIASIMMTFSGLFASDTVKTKLESKVDGGTYSEIQTMSQVTGSGGQARETVTVIGSHSSETNEDIHFRISVEMRGNNGTSSTSQSRSSTNVWSGVVMGTVGGITGTSGSFTGGSGSSGGGFGGATGGGVSGGSSEYNPHIDHV